MSACRLNTVIFPLIGSNNLLTLKLKDKSNVFPEPMSMGYFIWYIVWTPINNFITGLQMPLKRKSNQANLVVITLPQAIDNMNNIVVTSSKITLLRWGGRGAFLNLFLCYSWPISWHVWFNFVRFQCTSILLLAICLHSRFWLTVVGYDCITPAPPPHFFFTSALLSRIRCHNMILCSLLSASLVSVWPLPIR